jgi:hypothetical protein
MKTLLPLTLSIFLAGAVYAQQNPPPPPPDQQQADTTVTGCLTKGENAGQYMVTESKSGHKFTFSGSQRLDSYLNHTVELTGKMMTSGDEKAFQPQTIKTVSNSCEGPQKR